MQNFAGIVNDPYQYLKKLKNDTSKKIVGCFPMYVPEEIVHASGMIPFAVLESDGAVTQSDRYMMNCTCHVVRGTLDLALRGKMEFVDGLIFPDICEPIQVVADVWKVRCPAPFHYNLAVPMNLTLPVSKKYLIGQFESLRVALEKFSGAKISDEALSKSISIYNQNRRLINRLYEFRRNNPESISPKDLSIVIAAGMLIPKEQHNQMLEKLLASLKETGQPSPDKIKLILTGYFCDVPDPQLMKLFDETGVIIPDDDLFCGSRSSQVLADESLPPMEALADRYIKDVPCPTKYNPKNDWADHILNKVKNTNADAVLILNLKYCEPIAHDYPYLKKRLDEAQVPELFIEIDGEPQIGQIRTRLQAFIELVER